MPFDALSGDTDTYGRQVWRCRSCSATTVKEAEIGSHVCASSELGKEVSDDEADLVLEAVQKRMADGMEVFALQSNLKLVDSLAKTAEQQSRVAGEKRSTARSAREAGEIEGRVRTLNDQAKMFRALMNGIRGDLKRRGVDA